MPAIVAACEGGVDAAVVRRILRELGRDVSAVIPTGGKVALDARLPEFNRSAEHVRWLVLRDLDRDAPCAGNLVQRLLPRPGARMRLRIAVRAVESWLLADREGLAAELAVSGHLLPELPDELEDPKAELVAWAGRSRRKDVRRDLVPHPGSTARVGPAYTTWAIAFVERRWSPRRAADRSVSLARCLSAIETLG